MDWIYDWYDWIKSLHVISTFAWMAGMFYLPRLYVYHVEAGTDSEMARTFEVMERRLLRMIINPAMIATWLFGGLMLLTDMIDWSSWWIYIKLAAVVILSGVHGLFSAWRRDFAKGQNRHSSKFYRIVNEVPTILLIIIVFMVILKPF